MFKKINTKAKGTLAENEIVHKFWENNWVCVRVAGSGSSKYPAPDILASNGDRRIVMEIKIVNSYKKYFLKKQIDELNFFAEKFSSEPWVGICFRKSQWFFLPTCELLETKAENYLVDIIDMKKKGFDFFEMIRQIERDL